MAAVWFGGAAALAGSLWAAAGTRPPDQVALMHLGACDVSLHATLLSLRDAAEAIDAGRADGAAGRLLAARVRAQAAACAEQVLITVGHALGPGPLAMDAVHAARVADLTLYVRQHHAERDLAALGRLVALDLDSPDHRAPERRGHRVSINPVPFAHTDAGTPESTWLGSEHWDGVGVLDLPAVAQRYARVLVLSAHPDDETLGIGGLVADLADAGATVTVLVATDGERSHPLQGNQARAALAARRRREVQRAVRVLAPTARTTHLGLPDGGARPARGGAGRGGAPPLRPRHPRRRSVARGRARRPRRPRPGRRGCRVAERRRPRSLPDLAVALGSPGGAALGRRRGERDLPNRPVAQAGRAR